MVLRPIWQTLAVEIKDSTKKITENFHKTSSCITVEWVVKVTPVTGSLLDITFLVDFLVNHV